MAEESVIRKFRITAADGKSYDTQHYNLEVVITVGYRVKSPRGTQFRQWATARLSEYLVKGFTMDDERLKNPPGKGHTDYFDELLERIRDIRSSERRVYLRGREILALAADYSPSEPETQVFFQAVQNKLHFAATGKTAPELIAERVDSAQPNVDLTAWKSGVVRKGDVTVAKNYLREYAYFGEPVYVYSLKEGINDGYPDPEIVSALRRQLGWTHFKAIISMTDPLKRDFYAEMCRIERWSTRTLEKKIGSMLAALDELKRSLLHQAFTGRL